MTVGVSLYRRGLGCLALVAVASCGGGGGDGPGIVNAPVVVSVTVSPASVPPLDVGGTVTLTADVQAQNGASTAVTWSSSAPNVASVGQTGVVTAVAAGQTTITATSVFNSSKTGSVSVIVNAPQIVSITLNSAARSIRVGENFSVAATVDARGGLARTATFTSSNAAVATVSSSDGLTASIVGVSVGQATITARPTADATKSATIAVTVTGTARITSVTPSPLSLQVRQQVKLTPTVQADPGVSNAVTYQTQAAAVATVANDGTVTGVAAGQTSIIVTAVGDPTQRVTVPVTVTDPCLARVALAIPGTRTGSITDASCDKVVDNYSYTVSAQTAITLSATMQFTGVFAFIADRTMSSSSGIVPAGSTPTFSVVVAPGTYNASVRATDVAARGSYSVTTALTASFASLCFLSATTGVTVTLPLNSCSFQPVTRPTGTYRSFSVSMVPAIATNERVTITVTASGFTPLIEAHIGSFPPITAVAATGSNTAVQSFVGPSGNNIVFFVVSSVDPGQTGTFSVKIEGPPSLP
jgi:uncharacterized protein YjdB